MERISSGCGRRESSCKRVEYQVVASVHSWYAFSRFQTCVSSVRAGLASLGVERSQTQVTTRSLPAGELWLRDRG